MSELDQLIKMYPGQRYVYRTSDSIYHLTEAGAIAQAAHLANGSIDRITCKTRKVSLVLS